MQAKKIVLRSIALVFTCIVAFVGGFTYSDISTGVKHPTSFYSILSMIPQNIKIGLSSIAHGDQTDVSKPFEIYADTIATVQSEYYGKPEVTRELTYDGIRGMMASLNDRYTRFLDPTDYTKMQEDNQGEFVGIGAQLDQNDKGQVFVVKPLPGSPALKAHLMTGDIIANVDGKATLGMEITKVVALIRGEPHTPVTLTLIRKGVKNPITVTIVRNYVRQEVVVSKMIDTVHKIGYISLAQFNEESDRQISKAMSELRDQGMRGLVFDLRGNPGGLLNVAQDVASRFVASGPIVWVREKGSPMQGYFVESKQHDHPIYPLVVMVNGGSASASEITSGAIKDTHSGTLVGEQTFGKGLVQTIYPLADHSAVAITTAHYFTPAKHDINHKGIAPDILVKLTDDDERKMNDYVNSHPDDPIDLKFDRQLQKGVATVVAKLAAGEKPHSW